ncbi:hypothetical protein [Leucothrix arctica]|uniref:Uncharacterized protein n=1 Tax=Leucothrix arctica TaxID=1481894 RepID=A0A317CDP0_9GAMM|nr:hypothetical protein [Leucothrix arctica]PWQ94242.1 hypothetical protein DKT75_17050 [Leucothrix arctica]
MNTNLTFTCDVCEQDTDCRIGYSNRKIQPLSFSCPHCGSLMEITLDITSAPRSKFDFKRCKPSENQPVGLFKGDNPFVDLHLDFPVRFGKYAMGMTPFMMAIKELGASSKTDMGSFEEKMIFINFRLDQLNYFHDKSSEIKLIIKLYSAKNKQLFKKRVGDFLELDQGTSLKPQDINASLYLFVSHVFRPFLRVTDVNVVIEKIVDLTSRLPPEPLNKFMESIISSNFLNRIQKDCLKLYPEIYNAEMPMRPALFLDLVNNYEKAQMAARVSTKDFQMYKDLYKDIAEVFARQLILVAGINNIIHRGDSESFLPMSGKALSSLDKFASKPLSDKFKYLDDCWYPLEKDVVDASVRNAIAHNNVEYNDITQEITYFPKGGSIEPTEGQVIYFLDFMRMILVLFREVHNLHHLIKCLFYYEYLIRSKDES